MMNDEQNVFDKMLEDIERERQMDMPIVIMRPTRLAQIIEETGIEPTKCLIPSLDTAVVMNNVVVLTSEHVPTDDAYKCPSKREQDKKLSDMRNQGMFAKRYKMASLDLSMQEFKRVKGYNIKPVDPTIT